MKHIFLFLNFLLLNAFGFSQSVDLEYTNNAFTNASGGPVDANNFSINQVARLQVSFNNNSFTNNAPANRFSLIIGLGSGLILNPGYDLTMAPLSNYFTFTYAVANGQGVITGKCTSPVPPLFSGLTFFEVKATTAGASTASFNINIDNSAGPPFLTDPNTANNSALNPYNVNSVILPVTFAGITAAVKDCNVNLNWNVKGQTNLSHYEIEVSKDGTTYSKVNEVIVRNTEKYNLIIPISEGLKSPILYFRVKSVDKDGKFMYSETRSVKGQCDKSRSLNVSLYPNPVSYSTFVTITNTDGTFDGKYKAVLLDKSGKVYQVRDVELNNAKNFKFNFGNIAAGSYNIMLLSADESQSAVLEFTKL